MEGIIGVTAVVLIVIYIGLAIWVICKRRTVAGSIGASAGFLCGGLVMVPAASSIAAFICWTAVIAIVLTIIGAVFGG